ncbi:calcipressin-1-like [Sycon ciliatum]|uniref:calcipressin-1-like n=1 Tax=Sycon ciliatum TaxID=27933 RepID=UPI0031F68D0C
MLAPSEGHDELNRRGMRPEVKDVVYVVEPDCDDAHGFANDIGTQNESSSMLVVNNIPIMVFGNDHCKHKLETMFLAHGHAEFEYVKSMKRLHVTFNSILQSSSAKTAIDDMVFEGSTLRVYTNKKMEVDHQRLAPPKPKKLMLISPPSSPPDGWEQAPENNPAINYELVAALAGMSDDAGEIELQAETAQAPKLVVQSGP